MKITIANYKNIEHGYTTIDVVERMDGLDSFMRISQPVEVELIARPAEETVPQEVAILEGAREKLQAEYMKQQKMFDDRIANLLAITQQ